MRPKLGLAAATLMMLAGCAGGGTGDAPPTPADEPEELVVDTPAWALGDWWSYRIETDLYPAEPARMVYYEDAGDNYLVGIDSRDQALRHAVFNVNPVLGRVQKGNLAIYEDGTPRALYRFPMRDGTSWQTDLYRGTLNQEVLTAEATYEPNIEIGAQGTAEGFRIVAAGASGFRVTFDYVPEVQWFSHYEVRDASGRLLIRMELEEYGHGYQGPTWFMRGFDVYPETCGVTGNYTQGDMGPDGTRLDTCFIEPKTSHAQAYGQYDLLAFNVIVEIQEEDPLPTRVSVKDPDGVIVYDGQWSVLGRSGERFRLDTTEGFSPGEWEFSFEMHSEGWVRILAAAAYEYRADV